MVSLIFILRMLTETGKRVKQELSGFIDNAQKSTNKLSK